MQYDFNSIIDRHNTNSIKWDYVDKYFSREGLFPMWVADMDFRAPSPIIDSLRKVAEFGIFGYSGVPESFYEAVIRWMKKRHGWEIDRDWIVLSPGVVPALHVLVDALTQPGDQVILQTPVYYPFFHAVTCGDREILDNPLKLEGDQYVMDLAGLQQKITARTKMVILCNPHNPISRVWKREELKALGDLCFEHNIIVVSDEIHSDIVYSGFQHVPFSMVAGGFGDNTVICTAASKTFNLPGLQTSSIIIPNPDLKKRFSDGLHKNGVPSPGLFGVAATEAAYRYCEDWLEQLLVYLEGNIYFLQGYLSENMPGVRVLQPQGTYLLWLDFRNCGIPSDKLKDFVRDTAGVALDPGALFRCGQDGFERINIACPRTTLEKGLKMIADAMKKVSKD